MVSVTSSSITLQWMPPEPPNGIITQYSIQFDTTNISNFGSNMLNILMDTIEGLSPDTVYVLQLRAHNSVGAGPLSIITVITCRLLNTMYQMLASYVRTYIAKQKHPGCKKSVRPIRSSIANRYVRPKTLISVEAKTQ